MSRFSIAMASALALCLSACGGGGDDGDDADDGQSDAGDGDAGPPVSPCGFDGDDYLPYAAGYTWTYRLTDLDDGDRATKEQRIDPGTDHADYGSVMVQVTGKLNGETISLTRREGDRVLRFEQEDRDATGALERTTIYEPPQIRIDESPEHIAVDAMWNEQYTETVLGPDGELLTQNPTTDQVQILGVDIPCDSPMGEFRCLRVRRTRTVGGVAVKEFLFARGIGKIREVGANQLEELTDCAVAGE
jgi:hypothetical protein